MKEIIIYIVFAIVTQIVTYKFLRNIDKKERKFLKQWELEYINAYKDLWRESYFEKLAEEKKIKEYDEQKKEEAKELSNRLKTVKMNDSFGQTYEDDLQKAIEKLEKEE